MRSRFELPHETTMGTRLKEERLRLGFTQSDAAHRLGISRKWWSNFERDLGLRELRVTDLLNMSRWGLDVDFIVTGERRSGAACEHLAFVFATIRQTLAVLSPRDRHRLLLDLLAGEMAA